uniref:Uncharacterized protein n=1 Tax=Arundo donax TaxID=35708 RepID=A0A0A8XP05_ARUDO
MFISKIATTVSVAAILSGSSSIVVNVGIVNRSITKSDNLCLNGLVAG